MVSRVHQWHHSEIFTKDSVWTCRRRPRLKNPWAYLSDRRSRSLCLESESTKMIRDTIQQTNWLEVAHSSWLCRIWCQCWFKLRTLIDQGRRCLKDVLEQMQEEYPGNRDNIREIFTAGVSVLDFSRWYEQINQVLITVCSHRARSHQKTEVEGETENGLGGHVFAIILMPSGATVRLVLDGK